jgi:hypothetical protein
MDFNSKSETGSTVHEVLLRAKASYKGFRQNLLLDERRIDRILPRIQRFFAVHYLNNKSKIPDGNDYASQQNTASPDYRAKVGVDKSTLGGNKYEKLKKTSVYKNVGQSSPELDLRESRHREQLNNTRRDRKSADSDATSSSEARWRVKSEKSFGTVRLEVESDNSRGTIVLSQTQKFTDKEIKIKTRAKSVLNRDNVYRKPWLSRVLLPVLDSYIQSSQGRGRCAVSASEVSSADEKAVESFVRSGTLIERSVFLLLYQCGDEAVKRLCGLDVRQEQTILLSRPEIAVESLSKPTNSGFDLFMKKNDEY